MNPSYVRRQIHRHYAAAHHWMSDLTYAWVMSHINESCHIWMSHISQIHRHRATAHHIQTPRRYLLLSRGSCGEKNKKKAPHTLKRAPYTLKRALHTLKRTLRMMRRALAIKGAQISTLVSRLLRWKKKKGPTYSQKILIYSEKSPIYSR